MPAVINTVGQSFVPLKQGGPSSNLSIQSTINSSVQPNNCFLLANLDIGGGLSLTAGPPFVYTPLTWNLVSDSIVLGYLPTFTEIVLYRGVWDTQIVIEFGGTGAGVGGIGELVRITADLPSNLAGSQYTQLVPENVSVLFDERVAIQDPTITKVLPFRLSAIGLYYECRQWSNGVQNPGTTIPILAGQLLISRVG